MKDTIIIVEGAQGVGKTTFTNYLRENINSDLYRLGGISDRTISGCNKMKVKYEKLLEYINYCTDINLIFDRMFFSNQLYSKLGYHKYNFTDAYYELLHKLDSLYKFDIYLVILYLEKEEEYIKRLERDNKHSYQKFSAQNSINQQKEFLKLADEVESLTKNIQIVKFKNDIWEESVKQINKIWKN